MKTSKCPLWIKSARKLAEVCGGERMLFGTGPDAYWLCVKCRAVWTLDGKHQPKGETP